MNKDIIIRTETVADYRQVEELIRASFWNVYRPGCTEHYLLKNLRNAPDHIPELTFVMEQDGRIIGQNVFVRASIQADDGKSIPILTMGPICIANDLKRRGYGKYLLDATINQARTLGFGAICIEGNIAFYKKSGFRFASDYGIRYHGLPADADASFFLCCELIPDYLTGITGEYATPDCYFPDMTDFVAYDSTFPERVKLKLPGQLE